MMEGGGCGDANRLCQSPPCRTPALTRAPISHDLFSTQAGKKLKKAENVNDRSAVKGAGGVVGEGGSGGAGGAGGGGDGGGGGPPPPTGMLAGLGSVQLKKTGAPGGGVGGGPAGGAKAPVKKWAPVDTSGVTSKPPVPTPAPAAPPMPPAAPPPSPLCFF